jgi:hypothetical protein
VFAREHCGLSGSARRRRSCEFRSHLCFACRFGLLNCVSLRQRERNRAHSQKQKQIKSASGKMRFDGGINLFFHGVLFVRIIF